MTISEASDFQEECAALDAVLAPLGPSDYAQTTEFKSWSIEDVLVHLHFWNLAVDLAASDQPRFDTLMQRALPAFRAGTMRAVERAEFPERGDDLRMAWIANVRDMASRWQRMDPKTRIPWVGPSMSARSAMTARQMETWAHGYEVFDLLGLHRHEQDRIRNIVVLGINTFAWSHQVNGMEVPPVMPSVALTAPSGAVWDWGDITAGRISGPAEDFAAVVTQTRALADTQLIVEGDIAQTWMTHAQCFAGGAEKPPQPGSRTRRRAAP